MPSIEISAEQAQQLARGEDITVSSPKPSIQHFIAVNPYTGFVLEYETLNGQPQPWKVLVVGDREKAMDYTHKGYQSSYGFDFLGSPRWHVTQVPA